LAPPLPDLHVSDSLTRENVPVGGVEGWDADFLQTQTLCFAPMSFQAEDVGLVAGVETTMYWCRRLSKVIAKCSFSTAGASASIKPIYSDLNDIIVYGQSIPIVAGNILDGANFRADMELVQTYGANKLGFLLESISAGSLSIAVAGV